jgi:hypothetical protein
VPDILGHQPRSAQDDEELRIEDPDRLDQILSRNLQQRWRFGEELIVEPLHADDGGDGDRDASVADAQEDEPSRLAYSTHERRQIDDGNRRATDDREPGHERRSVRDLLDRQDAHRLDSVF